MQYVRFVYNDEITIFLSPGFSHAQFMA